MPPPAAGCLEPFALAGVVLAGGAGIRLGGAKDQCRLGGLPLVQHVIARMQPQVPQLLLNGEPAALAGFGLPVVEDALPGRLGPLAGILAAMDWLAVRAPDCKGLISAPVDTPFLPADLCQRLVAAVADCEAAMAMARSNGRLHPVIALWPLDQRHALRQALVDEGVRKITAWTGRLRLRVVDWPVTPHDPFMNINTPAELAHAESLLDKV